MGQQGRQGGGMPGGSGIAWRTQAALLLLAIGTLGAPAASADDDDIEQVVQLLVGRQETLIDRDAPEEWPYEGVYRVRGKIPIGYRVGGTALCALGLIQAPGYADDEARIAAVGRGLSFLLEALDHPLMVGAFLGGYDVRGWGQIYALAFMLELRKRGGVPEDRAAAVDAMITELVAMLEATAIPGTGGWNYSRRGDVAPASPFMTAPALLALFEARSQGEKVSAAVVEQALDALAGSRSELGAIPYHTGGTWADPEGATGRTPITETVLYLAGRSDTDRIRASVESFFEHWKWLEQRRKQTGTHVEPYFIAPYYFFYAHYYLAVAIEQLPADERPAFREQLAERLELVQEKSGGWNDRVFPRSESVCTAFGLMALLQPELPAPAAWVGR